MEPCGPLSLASRIPCNQYGCKCTADQPLSFFLFDLFSPLSTLLVFFLVLSKPQFFSFWLRPYLGLLSCSLAPSLDPSGDILCGWLHYRCCALDIVQRSFFRPILSQPPVYPWFFSCNIAFIIALSVPLLFVIFVLIFAVISLWLCYLWCCLFLYQPQLCPWYAYPRIALMTIFSCFLSSFSQLLLDVAIWYRSPPLSPLCCLFIPWHHLQWSSWRGFSIPRAAQMTEVAVFLWSILLFSFSLLHWRNQLGPVFSTFSSI